MSSRITINGKSITIDGDVSGVVISNGRITVGGVTVGENLTGIVEVKWEGPLASLQCDSSVTCGDVSGFVTADGSVKCQNVEGDVRAGGSVSCGNVTGSARAGGSLNAGDVGGDAKAGGSLNCTRRR